MKKSLLLCATLAMTLTVGAQRPAFQLQMGHNSSFQVAKSPLKVAKTPAKAPAKVLSTSTSLKKMWMGPYNSDVVAASTEGGGLSVDNAGYYTLMTSIPSTDLERFNGGRIVSMRVGLANADSIKALTVYGAKSDGYIYEICDTTFSKALYANAGWTEVKFNTPATFSTSTYTDLFLSFTYWNATNCNAVSFVSEGKENYPCYVLQNGRLYTLSGVEGNLSLQAGVEKEFPTVDLAFNYLHTNSFMKKGNTPAFSAQILNQGTEDVSNFTVKATIDGNDWQTFNVNNTLKPGATTTLTNSTNQALPDLSAGRHTLKMQITAINGNAPTEYTSDDAATANINLYEQTVEHQKQLIEQFTSWTCTFCPGGTKFLEVLESQRSDLAWVAVHGNQSPSKPDKFDVAGHDSLEYVESLDGWPSAGMNRVNMNGSLMTGINYSATNRSAVATQWSNMMDAQNQIYPALVSLDITPVYNPTSRKLDITVKGTGVEGAGACLDGYALTAYLTEDSLVAYQLDLGVGKNNYVHNRVLRKVLTNSILGDKIVWDGDNFTRTLSYTLPSDAKPQHMHIIAFVAPKLVLNGTDLNNCYVNQCQMADMSAATVVTGIEDVTTQKNTATVKAIYSASGERLTAPQKGLNIIVYSNGKTVKVMK